jgi:transposase-like protein
MAGRRIRDEQDARRCLASAKATRASIADWARAHGIDGRSLNAWRVNLSRRGVPRAAVVAPRLVELVPAASVGPPTARYVLQVGGVELEVGDDFHEPGLRRLVALLKSC